MISYNTLIQAPPLTAGAVSLIKGETSAEAAALFVVAP